MLKRLIPKTVSYHSDPPSELGQGIGSGETWELSESHLRLIDSLRAADRRCLRRLFHILSPPKIDSFTGEYESELLDQGGRISNVLTNSAFRLHGSWVGKAFHPINNHRGIGYNYFEHNGSIVQKFPMDTMIGTSTFSVGPSLMIRYSAKNRGLISWLKGEIRQVSPHVMLGMGIIGPKIGQRDICRRRIPFALIGPYRTYQQQRAA